MQAANPPSPSKLTQAIAFLLYLDRRVTDFPVGRQHVQAVPLQQEHCV